MSTADTALSISIKMAPGPEHRQEPVAPDKIAESDRAAAAATTAVAVADVVINVENDNTTTTGNSSNNNNNDTAAVVVAEQNSNIEIAPVNFAAGADPINQNSPSNSGVDSKQQVSIDDRVEKSNWIKAVRRWGFYLLFNRTKVITDIYIKEREQNTENVPRFITIVPRL